MKKINFISRHEMPTNLISLLNKAGITIEGDINHIRDIVSNIAPKEGELNIAVAPTAMFLKACEALLNMSDAGIVCMDMKRPVRPQDGSSSLPPTEVESLTIAVSTRDFVSGEMGDVDHPSIHVKTWRAD